jgi:hypothetical protein
MSDLRDFSTTARAANQLVLRLASLGDTYTFPIDAEARESIDAMLNECAVWRNWRESSWSTRGAWTS